MHWLSNGSFIDNFSLNENFVYDMMISPVDSKMFFLANSIFPPNNVYQYDLDKKNIIPSILHQRFLKGFDETKFHFKRLKYKSKDGTNIILIVIKKKNMKGTKPCMLCGYGWYYCRF